MRYLWCLVVMLAVAAVLLSTPARADEGMRAGIAASIGTFSPGSSDAAGWEDSTDVAFSILATKDRIGGSPFGFGLEGCLHFYSTGVYAPVFVDVTSMGTEALAFVYLSGRVQPYAGVGVGYYSNSLVEVSGMGLGTDSGMGLGVLMKAGLRVFPADGFFVGGYYKAFTNEQDVEDSMGNSTRVDFGGTVAAFESGFVF